MSALTPILGFFLFAWTPTLAAQSDPAKELQEPPPATEIAWHHDYDQARAKAKSEGKPLLAYFTFET